MRSGAVGLLPAVPLEVHAQRTGAERHLKACPRNGAEAAIGSSRFEPNWRDPRHANSDRFPVCAGPVSGLSVGLFVPSAPAVLDRSAARFRKGLTRLHTVMASAFLPFRDPTRASKRGIKFHSPDIRDAHRHADKLGRHARCTPSSPLQVFCQVPFREITSKN